MDGGWAAVALPSVNFKSVDYCCRGDQALYEYNSVELPYGRIVFSAAYPNKLPEGT